ncbi:MAG: alkaline phytoceramidase, partial [Acidobacteria bacterium]|nr:alkaline phytoceramidase [Acidobacteriota bacterium]
ATGIGSALYWQATWILWAEDERWYVLVQFFPLLAIPVILLLFPPRYTRTIDLLGVLGWYGLAKIFEGADALVFAAGRVVSGHTLKHLAAALAALWMLRMVKNRRPVE